MTQVTSRAIAHLGMPEREGGADRFASGSGGGDGGRTVDMFVICHLIGFAIRIPVIPV